MLAWGSFYQGVETVFTGISLGSILLLAAHGAGHHLRA